MVMLVMCAEGALDDANAVPDKTAIPTARTPAKAMPARRIPAKPAGLVPAILVPPRIVDALDERPTSGVRARPGERFYRSRVFLPPAAGRRRPPGRERCPRRTPGRPRPGLTGCAGPSGHVPG